VKKNFEVKPEYQEGCETLTVKDEWAQKQENEDTYAGQKYQKDRMTPERMGGWKQWA